MRCLQVLSGCLEFGDFDEVNAVMQTHIEKVVSISLNYVLSQIFEICFVCFSVCPES